ncbi:DUF4864 domain-containing protein [Halomicroarcula sp. GCM10025324]|uniref:DUF4864 domain-containing protein n=1 Tax=Haloarcula TaxID=2237 RepID=UPI0023E7922F|nr:DUF4864 domain-containing protein [Halomicroarcula sp. ZS-22-S1]
MAPSRPRLATSAVAALVVLSGCAGLFAGEDTETPEPTVTPAPVPEDAGRNTPPADTGTATPTLSTSPPNGRALGGTAPPRDYWAGITADENGTAVTQPRYLALEPTCERPPGQVVHIQVAALGNNDPTTDEGLNATWRFFAPSYRQSFGSYTGFTDTFIVQYRPLFTARAVAYGPLTLDGDVATQRVSVLGPDGATTSYTWRVENQTAAAYEGCWMTTGVVPVTSQ